VPGWPAIPGFPNFPRPPQPGVPPTPPGGGQGGPVDPGYSPPWAQVPGGGQGPGGPVDPGYSPPWAQVPVPPPSPPNLPEGGGILIPLPEGSEGPPPPEGTPEENVAYVVWFGPGTVAGVVYLPPVATTKPPVPGQNPPA
jgi:hypothetical protein